jgi:hypothetical protein
MKGRRVYKPITPEQCRIIEIDFAAMERRVIQNLLDQGYDVVQVHDEIIAMKPEDRDIRKALDFGRVYGCRPEQII